MNPSRVVPGGAVASWLVLGVLGGVSGCAEEKQDCVYWTRKLAQPGSAEQALAKVEEAACVEAIPELEKVFEEGTGRPQILRIIKKIGDKEKATPLLKKALLNKEVGKEAAIMATEWKLSAVRPELEEIIKTKVPQREGALKALLAIEGPEKLEALLIQLCQEDPDLQGIAVNRLAADKLGELGSKAAVPALLRAAFMRTQTGDKAIGPARRALARIDADAVVPQLVAILDNQDQAFAEWGRNQGLAVWEWTASPEIVQLLMDQLDSRATARLVANLIKQPIDPESPAPGVTPVTAEKWMLAQKNRLVLIWLAISHLGGDDKATVLDPLVGLLMDRHATSFEHQRMRAATILANLGSNAAIEALYAAYEKLESPAAQAPTVIHLGEAAGPEHLQRFDDLFKQRDKLSDLIKEKLVFERTVAYLAVLRDCQDRACFMAKLDSPDVYQVLKAAILLTRDPGDKKVVIDAFIRRFERTTAEDDDIRRWCMIGVTRLGDAATGERLLGISKALTDPRDVGWKDQLEAFGFALKRRK
jgi:HEAT repeat protein